MEEKLKIGRIYKLIDNTNGNIYIGSTTQTLNQRLSDHKCCYGRYLNGKDHYITSFDIIKNNNYKIECIEVLKNTTKQIILEREKYFIQNTKCINIIIPIRSKEEHEIQFSIYRKKGEKWYQSKNDWEHKKYECICGSITNQAKKFRHNKSIKHINYMLYVDWLNDFN
jgi:hypothetical protein